jgi:hypothetical protein
MSATRRPRSRKGRRRRKGFAIVAGEAKNLASQTAQATEQIAG